jgi:hypothetical protein
MNNLTMAYRYQGNLQEAADLQERRLEATMRNTGGGPLNNLICLEALGRIGEALSLIQQSVNGT